MGHAEAEQGCFLTVLLDAGSSILEEVGDKRRQIHSVAVLAHASADVATPLLLSASLKVRRLASSLPFHGSRHADNRISLPMLCVIFKASAINRLVFLRVQLVGV